MKFSTPEERGRKAPPSTTQPLAQAWLEFMASLALALADGFAWVAERASRRRESWGRFWYAEAIAWSGTANSLRRRARELEDEA